jgi:hypothetical protein
VRPEEKKQYIVGG